MIKITLSSILEDLSNGYTRKVTSKNYDSEIGSIQEKYSLTATEIDSLFKHPKLKGKKTTFAPKLSFELVDGVTLTSEESKEELAAIVLEVNHTNEVEVDSLSIDRMIKQNEKKVSKVPDILEEETEEVEANS